LREIGVEANAPNALEPLKLKCHFSFSFTTVRELIGVRVVAREFERS